MPRVVTTKQAAAPEVETIEQAPEVANTGTLVHEVPFAEPFPTGFKIHIEFELSGAPAMALRRIAEAYDRQQATLRDGTRVVKPTTALRKILEDLAGQMQ